MVKKTMREMELLLKRERERERAMKSINGFGYIEIYNKVEGYLDSLLYNPRRRLRRLVSNPDLVNFLVVYYVEGKGNDLSYRSYKLLESRVLILCAATPEEIKSSRGI